VADLPEWAIDADDIPDNACLLRRVPPNLLSGPRPETSNFRNKEAGFGLSVTLWAGDGDLADIRRGHELFGVVTIVVGDARALGLLVARSPLDGNQNHCEVFPTISKGRQNLLRNACEWVVYPEVIPPEQREPVVVWHEQWERRISAEEVARVCK
jgi:hypothetical protein